MHFKRITVFCGSSSGTNNIYLGQARLLGKELAKRDIELIYGGAKVGLMGAVADGVLSEGGIVTGIMPEFLKNKEINHANLSELIWVKSMHERKTLMSEMCDAVIALPGGFGTLEEFFEILTWAQLGLHNKPMAILNINGFYDHLLALIDNMVNEHFLKEVNMNMILVSDNIPELLEKMENYKPVNVQKWI
jgi:hypothetical protein